jgi:hypothetical protein
MGVGARLRRGAPCGARFARREAWQRIEPDAPAILGIAKECPGADDAHEITRKEGKGEPADGRRVLRLCKKLERVQRSGHRTQYEHYDA